MRSFTTICLFLLLGISLAEELAPVTFQPVESEYYCSSLYPEPPEVCPEIYEPVCAKYQVQCIQAPCPSIEQTYPSGCNACQDTNVISYTSGACKKKIEVKHCKEDYPYPPYPCPKNYDPVCVSFDVECIKAPCPPIKKEYSNACMACNDYAGSYTPGPCEGDYEENEEEENYEDYENGENGEGWICEDYEDYENEEGQICEDYEEFEECEEYEEYEEEEEPEKKVCIVIPNTQVLCISDYIPVCGYFEGCPNGVCQETYRNNCVACYYAGADYYIDGECPSESES